ncbi:MAG: ATP-binding protein [Firmicutes bacterium]|nr:ATP-binding protein [Bacillota bacterium]
MRIGGITLSSSLMNASALLIGFAIGVFAAIPAAWLWGRRTARRVRHLEQQARTNERLVELGTLTGGLAHEIKNPLSTVGLNIQLLQEDLSGLSNHADSAGAVREGVRRIGRRFEGLAHETERLRDILEDFLRYAGRLELEIAPTPMNPLLEEVTDFFEPQAREAGVNVRRELSPRAGNVPLDESLFKQALLNLLINAVQAMAGAREANKPHGGARDLIVRSERRRLLGSDRLLVHVIDTGPGMDEPTIERIFQPYFSTKRSGTGLGLPTTRRIIEEHAGFLDVHSEPGRGTDFVISLPVDSGDDGNTD